MFFFFVFYTLAYKVYNIIGYIVFIFFCSNVCLSVCVNFFFSVKDFSGTTAPRVLKFYTNFGYDYLCCVRENQHPHACHSFYLSIFSFFPIKFFVLDFSGTTAPSILKFCTNIGYDSLYLVRENQHPHAYLFHYLSIFLFL